MTLVPTKKVPDIYMTNSIIGTDLVMSLIDDDMHLIVKMNMNTCNYDELAKIVNVHFGPDSAASINEAIYNYTLFSNNQDVPSLAQTLPGYGMLVKNPARDQQSKTALGIVIMDLNDHWKWTREQIADWIETLDEVPVFEAKEVNNGEKEFSPITVMAAFKPIL